LKLARPTEIGAALREYPFHLLWPADELLLLGEKGGHGAAYVGCRHARSAIVTEVYDIAPLLGGTGPEEPSKLA